MAHHVVSFNGRGHEKNNFNLVTGSSALAGKISGGEKVVEPFSVRRIKKSGVSNAFVNNLCFDYSLSFIRIEASSFLRLKGR